MRFILQGFLLPAFIVGKICLAAGQNGKSIPHRGVQRLHTERGRTRAVERGGITERREGEGQVRVVGVAQVPMRTSRADPFKIHKRQVLAHGFPAAAGDNDIGAVLQKEIVDFRAAGLGRVALAGSFVFITVGTEHRCITFVLEQGERSVKCAAVRLYGTAEGRSDKTDPSSGSQKIWISHHLFLRFQRIRRRLLAVFSVFASALAAFSASAAASRAASASCAADSSA